MLKKFFLPLLFVFIFFSGFSQEKNNALLITENFNNAPLEGVISILKEKYDLIFFYKQEWLEEEKVSLNLKDQDLKNALSAIFDKRKITFELLDSKTVLLLLNNFEQKEVNRPITTLSGKVRITFTEQPASNITVYISELQKGALTDENGNYSIEVPVGTHKILFSSLSHLDETYDVNVSLEKNTFDVELFEKKLELDNIVISAESIENNISSTETGKVVMTVNSIKNLPTFLGEVDISKIIKSLPGVQSVGEGASGFNVRGGNLDQNLILMDGFPIFNSSHLLGFFSVFNPDLVNTFTLYKGSIPSRFGGRISSVLEVNLKSPDDKKFKVQGGIGPVASKFYTNIPLIKDKAAISVGTRLGYPTWIIQRFKDENVQDNSAGYFDINLKYQHKLSKNDILDVSTYFSNDNFGFGSDSTFNYSTRAFSANWSHTFSNKLSSKLTAYMSDYDASLDDRTEAFEAFFENGVTSLGGKVDFLYEVNNSLSFNSGVDFQKYDFSPGQYAPTTDISAVAPQDIANQEAFESALFIDSKIKLNTNFSVSAGLRFSQFFNTGPANEVVFDPNQPRSAVSIIDTLVNSDGIYRTFTGLEPRLSSVLKVNASTSFKASYTRTFQYVYLLSNSTATLPTDIWKPSDNNIRPQKADQFSLGIVKSLNDNTYQVSVDAFYKDIAETSEVALGGEVLLNDLLVSDIQNAAGRAYGTELFIQKAKGKITGWMSYTLSRSEKRIVSNFNESTVSKGDYFLSNFDRPHNLNLSATWKASRLWTIAANFVYSSGRPVTLPTSSFGFNGVRVFTFTERNNFRVPDTHRLDFSATLEGSNKRDRKWDHSFTFSIYNLYSRRNPFSVYFKAVDNTKPRTFRLAVLGSIFPSFTYNFKFEK